MSALRKKQILRNRKILVMNSELLENKDRIEIISKKFKMSLQNVKHILNNFIDRGDYGTANIYQVPYACDQCGETVLRRKGLARALHPECKDIRRKKK